MRKNRVQGHLIFVDSCHIKLRFQKKSFWAHTQPTLAGAESLAKLQRINYCQRWGGLEWWGGWNEK